MIFGVLVGLRPRIKTTTPPREKGVQDGDDFFGGVTPHPVAATKAITQPLVERDAAAPFGWAHGFHRDVAKIGIQAWTWTDVEPYFRKSETSLSNGLGPHRGSSGKALDTRLPHYLTSLYGTKGRGTISN